MKVVQGETLDTQVDQEWILKIWSVEITVQSWWHSIVYGTHRHATHYHVYLVCVCVHTGSMSLSVVICKWRWKGEGGKGVRQEGKMDLYRWMAGNPGLRCGAASLSAPEAPKVLLLLTNSGHAPFYAHNVISEQHCLEPAIARSRE